MRREVIVVYTDGVNINKKLIENNLQNLYKYCDIFEFKKEICTKLFG